MTKPCNRANTGTLENGRGANPLPPNCHLLRIRFSGGRNARAGAGQPRSSTRHGDLLLCIVDPFGTTATPFRRLE